MNGYRNNCVQLSRCTYTRGRQWLVTDLLLDGSHRLETWGNAREGFGVYLTAAPDFSAGVELSNNGPFTRRTDADAACKRTYGTSEFSPKIFRGRNFP